MWATHRACRWGRGAGGLGGQRPGKTDPSLLRTGGRGAPDATSRVGPAVASTVDEEWHVVAHSSQTDSSEGEEKEKGERPQGWGQGGSLGLSKEVPWSLLGP